MCNKIGIANEEYIIYIPTKKMAAYDQKNNHNNSETIESRTENKTL